MSERDNRNRGLPGIPMLSGWGDSLAGLPELGKNLANIINPNREIQEKLKELIAKDPGILQEFANQESENPGITRKLYGKQFQKVAQGVKPDFSKRDYQKSLTEQAKANAEQERASAGYSKQLTISNQAALAETEKKAARRHRYEELLRTGDVPTINDQLYPQGNVEEKIPASTYDPEKMSILVEHGYDEVSKPATQAALEKLRDKETAKRLEFQASKQFERAQASALNEAALRFTMTYGTGDLATTKKFISDPPSAQRAFDLADTPDNPNESQEDKRLRTLGRAIKHKNTMERVKDQLPVTDRIIKLLTTIRTNKAQLEAQPGQLEAARNELQGLLNERGAITGRFLKVNYGDVDMEGKEYKPILGVGPGAGVTELFRRKHKDFYVTDDKGKTISDQELKVPEVDPPSSTEEKNAREKAAQSLFSIKNPVERAANIAAMKEHAKGDTAVINPIMKRIDELTEEEGKKKFQATQDSVQKAAVRDSAATATTEAKFISDAETLDIGQVVDFHDGKGKRRIIKVEGTKVTARLINPK